MEEIYLIGEIGQNHNGSVDIAKLIIDCAVREPVEDLFNLRLKGLNAVKLTKRDLNYELSTSQLNKPYNSPHSFGRTYGDHRKVLELSNEQHFEIYKYAKAKGLDFVETLCAPSCTSIFKYFTPDYLKVASRDLTNLPLLSELAKARIPMILSTGMSGKEDLNIALETIGKYHDNISILHCVSQYPTAPKNVNLNSILFLRKKYPTYTIGYSDHTIGISIPVAAVAMGAKIIEKHITLDRRMKGTDQCGSLGPDGLNRMVRDIRLLEMSMGVEDTFICESVIDSKVKLERSIALKIDLKKGDMVTIDNIHLLSPGNGVKWIDRGKILGKQLAIDKSKNELVFETDLIH
ncbi:N-acetylneuraminate synthase family protein [Cyclobacterium marinum]|uniref:N-acetylneuraminate synthase family protein n=1 Tax=Cyclobacterium marinum TaxID=104 RepID=UPI0011EDE88F|nr:N-acetylneuraminate synthase family protein [Cyclobacterium marinum]MBI0397193.1 N-acetylneuraminate synthase family protein [Cyclobacterium marinum]